MPANIALPRLLIVDDSPPDVYFLRHALSEYGLEVEIAVADDGEKAIQYLDGCPEDRRPGVVVIDINLPKREGVEVLRKCRINPALVGTKTLVFSSSDELGDHHRAAVTGANAYMRKPMHLDDYQLVVSTIRELLRSTNAEPAGTFRES
jgi:CheY-like chemotaxis protein